MDTVVQFSLKLKNDNGTFSIDLKRDVNQAEIMNIALIASNILLDKAPVIVSEKVFGPQLPPTNDDEYNLSQQLQPHAKFGKAPVTVIKMGDYKEPAEGVRLKIFPFAIEHRMPAIRILRSHTGISILGCRDIVDGNFPCPRLSTLIAAKVYAEFRIENVYCRIIDSEEQAA